MSSRFDELRIFTGNGHPELTRAICQRLSIPMGDMTVTSFANDNIFVKLNESVREKDVFVVQSLGLPLSDRIMELLIMLDACKRASAGRVTAVLVDEGEFVKAGDVLARMDTAVLEAQMREAQAQLRQAKSSVAVAHSQVTQRESERAAADAVVAQREAERDVAKKRVERTESLAKQTATSEQQLDDMVEFLKWTNGINTEKWPPNIEG